MDSALNEGETLVNDMCESQLLSLIKDKHFGAIRFWLTQRHHKYTKNPMVVKADDKYDSERIIKELGLTDDDFSDENIQRTEAIISNHIFGR
jgi:hypothetical protein